MRTFDSRKADNIYINLNKRNDRPYVDNPYTNLEPASVSVNYDSTIIDNQSEYYMSVVKFQIPLEDVPLFVMPIAENLTRNLPVGLGGTVPPADPVSGFEVGPILTSLVIGVCESVSTATFVSPPAEPWVGNPGLGNGWGRNVVYKPSALGFFSRGEIENLSSPFYYMYTYSSLIKMVNVALYDSWVDAGSPGGAGAFPYMVYNENEGTFTIMMPVLFVDAAAANGNGWTIFMNRDLNSIFQAFDYDLYADAPTTVNNSGVSNIFRLEIDKSSLSYDNTHIEMPPVGNGTRLPPVAPEVLPAVYSITQDYSSFEYINSIKRIILISNSISCRPEYTPASTAISGGSNASQVNILADFQLEFNNKPGEQRSIATYNSDLYRMIDLISTDPLRKVDVEIRWVDNNNISYPLHIPKYNPINIKLGFFRKDAISGRTNIGSVSSRGRY